MTTAERPPWWKGQRGEWYVVAQDLIGLLIIFAPRTLPGLPAWPPGITGVTAVASKIVIGAGIVQFIWGLVALGNNLTPLPLPKNESVLVGKGPYRLVRHPIYGGIILMFLGFAIYVEGWLTLVYVLMLVVCFDLKSRREEKWLMEKYPDYRLYSLGKARFIPFIY